MEDVLDLISPGTKAEALLTAEEMAGLVPGLQVTALSSQLFLGRLCREVMQTTDTMQLIVAAEETLHRFVHSFSARQDSSHNPRRLDIIPW